MVIDCAAQNKAKALNSELLQGPDLINNLVSVLTCFLKVLLRSKLRVTFETKTRSLQLIRCTCTCFGH